MSRCAPARRPGAILLAAQSEVFYSEFTASMERIKTPNGVHHLHPAEKAVVTGRINKN
jgi:hypothetical protein